MESLTLIWGLPSWRGLTSGRSPRSVRALLLPCTPSLGTPPSPAYPLEDSRASAPLGQLPPGPFPLTCPAAAIPGPNTSLVFLNVHHRTQPGWSREGAQGRRRLRGCRRQPGFTVEAGEERGEPAATGEGTPSPATGSSGGGGGGKGGLEKAVAAGPVTCGVTEPLHVLPHGGSQPARLPY